MSTLVVLRLVVSAPVLLVAVGSVLALSSGREMRLAALVLCTTLLIGAAAAVRAAFPIRLRNTLGAWITTGNSILWLLFLLLVIWFGGNLVVLALAYVAAFALQAVAQIFFALRLVELRPGPWRQEGRSLLRDALPLGVGTFLALAYGRVDQVIVFAIEGDRAASYYGAVYRILDQARFVPLALVTTVMPLIAAVSASSERDVRPMISAGVRFLLVATLPALALSIVASGRLVRLLFGATFEPAAPALPVLMGALVVTSLGLLAAHAAVALGRQAAFARAAGVGLVFNVAANLVLVPRYGFMAAAWTTLATELLVGVWWWVAAFGDVGMSLGWRRDVAVPCAGALLTAATFGALDALDVPFAASLVAACCAYAGWLLVTGAVGPNELRAFRRGALGRQG